MRTQAKALTLQSEYIGWMLFVVVASLWVSLIMAVEKVTLPLWTMILHPVLPVLQALSVLYSQMGV